MNELDKKELEEVQESNEEIEAFAIKNLETANWAFRKLSAYHKRVKEKEDLAKKEIERIQQWFAEETKKDVDAINYFEFLLTQYYEEQRAIDKKFKLSTPYGKMTSRKKQPKMSIEDENRLIGFLEEKKPEIVETVKKYNLTEVKKLFKVVPIDNELKAIDQDGEELPFLTFEPQADSYTIKPNMEE